MYYQQHVLTNLRLFNNGYREKVNLFADFHTFCGEGPRRRSYGRTAALRLIVQPCDAVVSIFPFNGATVK